jgi:uncharacterized protein
LNPDYSIKGQSTRLVIGTQLTFIPKTLGSKLRTEGQPSEQGLFLDARAARSWLAKRKGIDEADIIVMGQSLGGGVAIDLASNQGARALVVASTFTSLPEAAQAHLPWMLPQLNMTQRMNSLEKIRKYNGTVLISHGDADETIPFSQGQRLYEAAQGPKRFVQVRGGKHNDPQPQEFRQALDELIDSTSSNLYGSTGTSLSADRLRK